MKKPKFEVPFWVPERPWEAYVEMRIKTKHPMTDYAKKLAIAKLGELMHQGHTPTAVLEQSIFYSWQGLFPVKQEQKPVGPGPRAQDYGVRPTQAAIERARKREQVQ